MIQKSLLSLAFGKSAAYLKIGLNGAAVTSKYLHTSDFSSTAQAPELRPLHKIKCTLIPGDGVGPELVSAVQDVFKASGVPIQFEQFFMSEMHPSLSAPLDDVSNSITQNGIALKGVLSTPFANLHGELQSLNMRLRQQLNLFANVVHIKSLPGIKTRHTDLDFIIIREQTEGEYSALEHECVEGVVECYKIVTKKKSEQIAKFAFDYATKYGRKSVTAVHKANIMKLGDGLFLKSCEEISHLYPKIKFRDMIIDNCTMQLVSKPHQFDVLVMPNLYGNIVDNLATGLVGGAGVVAGASYSADCVVFEPGARHAFSEAVGRNLANPTAMILCGCKMLRHVNLESYADMIKTALLHVLKTGKVRTRDLGGYASTTEFTHAVINSLKH
ncbi:putative isocitrate dehydrogenase [NAD] subunit beta, mitochondrial [Chamberlinius hualienensis]